MSCSEMGPTSAFPAPLRVGLALGVLAVAAGALPQATIRASVSSTGVQANAPCLDPALSADGRFVAFYSGASTLVPGDTNVNYDIFVRDLVAGTTVRASVDSAGLQANDRSFFPSLSADGRYVAFQSRATNLVAGDTNGKDDIFVHDLVSGTTTLVSVDSNGVQANQSSLQAPAISGDGRYVAWHSSATNLVPGDTNGTTDVFVHDLLTLTTERVSVLTGGGQWSQGGINPYVSFDGRTIAFESYTPFGISDAYVHDRLTNTTERVSVRTDGLPGDGSSDNVSLSDDGRFVAFESSSTNLVPGDTNNRNDIFVRDRLSATTERVSLRSDGLQGNDSSLVPAISPDGRYVAFTGFATNLVAGDTNGWEDIFLHDRYSGLTVRESLRSNGTQGNNSSDDAALAGGARLLAFTSLASNLVPGDTNGAWDIFVRDRRHHARR